MSIGTSITHERTDTSTSQPTDPYSFYHQDPYPGGIDRAANTSSSTVHAPASSGRRTPAKLRRRRRPGSKANLPRTPPTSYTALSRKHSRVSQRESAESVTGSVAPGSSVPSQSLDTLLNSPWPEPPVEQPPRAEGGQEQTYNYLSETGAEDDSDQEYLPSPTSIGELSPRPTSPKHSGARPRSRSPGHAIREQRVVSPVIHAVLGDQADWEAESTVTSYLSTSPTSPAVKAPPIPPLPQQIASIVGQNTGNASTIRPVGAATTLPLKLSPPGSRSTSVTPTPAAKSSPARTALRTASPSSTRATTPTPRESAAPQKPRGPSATPILRSPPVPRRSTSYHSAASLLQSPRCESPSEYQSGRVSLEERRPSVDDKPPIPPISEDRRSTTSTQSKRRSPTQARKEFRRPRRDSTRSHGGSVRSHRDSITLRKDSLQTQRRDSIQSRKGSIQRQDSANSPQDQISSDNQIWSVPRNYRQRPTISFEFPPTNEFWNFLNEYQNFCNRDGNLEDSGYATIGNEMSERRSGSAASGSSKSSKSKVDPVKDWHKVQPSSSRASSERTSTPYVPTAEVVERNELIVKALKNAPGALHTRFRHFGQLGVLGWSSEFSELVDEIQRCGLERQMFTTTREQALATCKALLKLHLEIRLQMITMFLCSQIARLRRFLDAETEYTDYPTPDFPLPETY